MAMRVADPDSVFEPIEGMLYIGTTRSRRSQTVKVLRTTPQTVIYMQVGRGTSGRERSGKVSREKFIRVHAPGPHTPYFAPITPGQASAKASATVIATAFVTEPAAETSKEAPMPAAAPAPTPIAPVVRPKPSRPPGPVVVPERPAPPTRPAPPRRISKGPTRTPRAPRFTAEQAREMYQLAADVPADKSRWGHFGEIAGTYGCSPALVAQIAKGEAHRESTADLRLSHIRAAEARLNVTPMPEPPQAAVAPIVNTVPVAEERPPAQGSVISAGGTARLPMARHGDGPPPGGPGDRRQVGEAAILLSDSAELIQTLARCVIRRRPLPTYISMRTVEELASRCEAAADRLGERG